MRIINFRITLLLLMVYSYTHSQCQADYTVVASNFEFFPSQLVVSPGETVAFVNIEGDHTLNGLTNSITGESFNNPVDIFLEQTTGNFEGVCMGVVPFDTAGIFSFDCSVGYNAQAGMNLEIVVDAFDLNDLMIDMYSEQTIPVSLSYYAFSLFCDSLITQSGPWTVFIPNNSAVEDILEYMNLGQFDALNIPDLSEILEYHIAEGNYFLEDLNDGEQLTTSQGQPLQITQANETTYVNGAQIVSSNYVAYNGVIHVIDSCLAPQDLPQSTVMEIIRSSESHQILEDAIVSIGLEDDLSVQATIDESIDGPGPWTVFAPTDDALAIFAEQLNIPSSEILNSQFISNIVKNHIVEYEIYSDEMFPGNVAVTLQNEQIVFETSDTNLLVTGSQNTVEIIVKDLKAYNGIVHVIDAVLSPSLPAIEGTCDIWQLELVSSSNQGWGSDELFLYKNNEFIETLTVFEGSQTRLYNFGVNIGDEIDLYYVPNGGGAPNKSFKLVDSDGGLIINSLSDLSSDVSSYVDIIACQTNEKEYCGKAKVQTFSDYNGGWYGTLDVYRNNSFEKSISMPVGYSQIAYLNVYANDSIKFIVNNPVWPEETGYIVTNTLGQLVVDEDEYLVAPQNSNNLIFCKTTTDDLTWNCLESSCMEQEDAAGLFSSLTQCQEVCGTSTITDNSMQFNVYPNPSSGFFKIKSNLSKHKTELIVLDHYSRVVFKATFENDEYQLDLSNYPKGIYNLQFKSSTNLFTKKIVLI